MISVGASPSVPDFARVKLAQQNTTSPNKIELAWPVCMCICAQQPLLAAYWFNHDHAVLRLALASR